MVWWALRLVMTRLQQHLHCTCRIGLSVFTVSCHYKAEKSSFLKLTAM
jgi:hypothetical protein